MNALRERTYGTNTLMLPNYDKRTTALTEREEWLAAQELQLKVYSVVWCLRVVVIDKMLFIRGLVVYRDTCCYCAFCLVVY